MGPSERLGKDMKFGSLATRHKNPLYLRRYANLKSEDMRPSPFAEEQE
jgi:hypothetical protein